MPGLWSGPTSTLVSNSTHTTLIVRKPLCLASFRVDGPASCYSSLPLSLMCFGPILHLNGKPNLYQCLPIAYVPRSTCFEHLFYYLSCTYFSEGRSFLKNMSNKIVHLIENCTRYGCNRRYVVGFKLPVSKDHTPSDLDLS